MNAMVAMQLPSASSVCECVKENVTCRINGRSQQKLKIDRCEKMRKLAWEADISHGMRLGGVEDQNSEGV